MNRKMNQMACLMEDHHWYFVVVSDDDIKIGYDMRTDLSSYLCSLRRKASSVIEPPSGRNPGHIIFDGFADDWDASASPIMVVC
jgi:hypothetical protein